jgi:hypothetical protein
MTAKESRKQIVDVENPNEELMEELAEEFVEDVAQDIVEEVAIEMIEEMAKEMIDEIDEEVVALAENMFRPRNKNPYYLNDKALNNLQDLVDNIDSFTGNEGLWVADWLEYLGDEYVAALIRNWPDDFKQLVIARYNKLQGFRI